MPHPFILYRGSSYLSPAVRPPFIQSCGASLAPHWRKSPLSLAQVSPPVEQVRKKTEDLHRESAFHAIYWRRSWQKKQTCAAIPPDLWLGGWQRDQPTYRSAINERQRSRAATSQTTAGNQRETAPADGNQSTDRRPTDHRATYRRPTYRRAINERQRSRSATSCFRSSSSEAKRCSARMRSRNSTQISRP